MQGVYRGMALALVAIFLASVARFYHPTTGFTALIAFPDGNDSEAPALQDLPHERVPPWASYDGQFYAQRALDPLARDPRVDRAMDLAPVSRTPHSVQLDSLRAGSWPARLDSRSVRAAERRSLADPGDPR